jgi:antitoxin PrlF
MTVATLTSKGQTTIPKEIRSKLGLKAGAKLHFNLMPDGTISVRAKTGTLKDLAGILHRPGRPAATLEEMNAAVARAAVARFKRGTRK